MNYTRPRYTSWSSKFVTAVFLLFLGGLVNQFWNIPRQQAQMDVLRQELSEVKGRLNVLEQQHQTMMGQLDRLQKQHETH